MEKESDSYKKTVPKKLQSYWSGLLGMEVYERNEKSAILGFSKSQCSLRLVQSDKPIDHAEAFGRIAFACPSNELKGIEAKMKEAGTTILTSYISLDTPGKATVQVVILADLELVEIIFCISEKILGPLNIELERMFCIDKFQF
ncbi:glyoxalase domain-containing protein 4-like [Clytia hemisphaerica]|uniref:glyoxalase domain-containing protein 4-like n=1 Tax=Clytia hemisphaerica TaxID=252671 RepID=UPI0034D4FF38